MSNTVYIATSLDGYIADRNGGLDFLQTVPAPEGDDLGFGDFMASIDALIMGRITMETVLGFNIGWPYDKPVFVLSNTMSEVPEILEGKAEIIQGTPTDISAELKGRGFEKLYIDGGKVIQSFLDDDLIDDMIITTIPILLGGGSSLFGALSDHLEFDHVSTEILAGAMVKSHYKRKR